MNKFILLFIVFTTTNCQFGDDQHPDFHHSKVISRESSSQIVNQPHQKHHLPPVAMPGILNEFDYAANRHKRMLLTELRALQKRNRLDQVLRRKRGMVFPQRIPYKPIKVNRNKRDLRRLRRDLSYEMSYAIPNYSLEKRQLGIRPISTYHAPATPQIDLEDWLNSVDLLDRLSILKQASSEPTLSYVEKPRSRHTSPSRFAPQPMLFQGQNIPRHAELVPVEWNGAKGKPTWTAEKRSPRSGLSMVPGFKRSAFREAERMNMEKNFPKVRGNTSEDMLEQKD